MVFSKSFGYAARGVLYIATMQEAKPFVQAEEIARELAVPRHFVSKILKRLAKAGIISSSKGKTGGFRANETTGNTSLASLVELTDGTDIFQKCVLRLHRCGNGEPCPVHEQMSALRENLRQLLTATTIADLLRENKQDLIKSIATVH